MGAAAPALVAAVVAGVGALAGARGAEADPCTGVVAATAMYAGGRFATCFDPGNRLVVDAGTDGVGGAIALRHDIHFADEPDLVWKMEHTLLGASYDTFAGGSSGSFVGRVYRGVFIRHSRDGHIVLPFGDPPAKVFLPFDVGALFEVGELAWNTDASARIGVVKTAALIDVARSKDHRLRLAFGPVASWDVDLTRMPELALSEQLVAPFTSGLVDLHAESSNGLDIASLRVETGYAWSTTRGWLAETRAEASLERTVISVNDRPVSLVVGARYDSALSEATAGVALRFAVIQRTDPRVQLLPSE